MFFAKFRQGESSDGHSKNSGQSKTANKAPKVTIKTVKKTVKADDKEVRDRSGIKHNGARSTIGETGNGPRYGIEGSDPGLDSRPDPRSVPKASKRKLQTMNATIHAANLNSSSTKTRSITPTARIRKKRKGTPNLYQFNKASSGSESDDGNWELDLKKLSSTPPVELTFEKRHIFNEKMSPEDKPEIINAIEIASISHSGYSPCK